MFIFLHNLGLYSIACREGSLGTLSDHPHLNPYQLTLGDPMRQ
ncbi:hypothetical protein [Synechococcus sp. R5-16]